jgi:hypothetical protein
MTIAALGWCVSLLGLLQLPIWMAFAVLKQPNGSLLQVKIIFVMLSQFSQLFSLLKYRK